MGILASPKTLFCTRVTNTASPSHPPEPRHFQSTLENLLQEVYLGFYKHTRGWNAISMYSAPGPLVFERRPAIPRTSFKLRKSKLSGGNFLSYLPADVNACLYSPSLPFLQHWGKRYLLFPRSVFPPDLDAAPYLCKSVSPSFVNSQCL